MSKRKPKRRPNEMIRDKYDPVKARETINKFISAVEAGIWTPSTILK